MLRQGRPGEEGCESRVVGHAARRTRHGDGVRERVGAGVGTTGGGGSGVGEEGGSGGEEGGSGV